MSAPTFTETTFVEGEKYTADNGVEYCFIDGCMLVPEPDPVVVPDEVYCGDAPVPAEAEVWITNGVTKVKNDAGIWVQTTPYGA